MSTSGAAIHPYDEIPYLSEPLPQSHPDHLAAVATLFGMRPPTVDRCRVLELGSATGGNLIPMAEGLPQSQFVGIDDSQAQIAAGRRVADALGLANLELRHADIGEIGRELGTFDYILAHGVFSRLSPEAQDQLLALCGSLLNQQGVALVSYNVLPGWHERSIIREVLWRHAPPGAAASERLAQGRALLEFFSTSLGKQSAPSSRLLKQQIEAVLRQPDQYIWREYFEMENHPLYFHQFVSRAARFGLKYLGDSVPATMFAASFGPLVEQQVRNIADDVISAEQHLDLLRNRAFRQTLLCHKGTRLARRLTPDRLQTLHVAAPLRSSHPQPDLKGSAVESFTRPDGRAVSSPAPALKAALYYLGTVWPRAVSMDELAAGATALLGAGETPCVLAESERRDLGHNLAQCVASGLVEVTSLPDGFTTTVSPRPQTSRLARMQGGRSKTVTNRRHQSVRLNESARQLLQHLDGAHDHEALLKELVAAVDRGEVSIFADGIPATRGQDVSQALAQTLQQSLAYLAANALLVA
jgi:methyltransferase-like protein